jgi:hypothetical protein
MNSIYNILQIKAATEAADYIQSHISRALIFQERERFWDFALSRALQGGSFVEFGVFGGGSINYFARRLAPSGTRIFGFDSFEGLQEDWFGTDAPRGMFDRGGGLPPVAPNVTLIKGWFTDTLPVFLSEYGAPLSFAHIDCDCYEPTRAVLNLAKDRVVHGTVLIFDEYLGYPNWKNGEFLAWKQFTESNGIKYEYIAFCEGSAACIVL